MASHIAFRAWKTVPAARNLSISHTLLADYWDFSALRAWKHMTVHCSFKSPFQIVLVPGSGCRLVGCDPTKRAMSTAKVRMVGGSPAIGIRLRATLQILDFMTNAVTK